MNLAFSRLRSYINMRIFFLYIEVGSFATRFPVRSGKPLGEMVIKMCLCGSGRPLSYCYIGLSLLEASVLLLVIYQHPIVDSQWPAAENVREKTCLAGRVRREMQGCRAGAPSTARRACTLAVSLLGQNCCCPSVLLGHHRTDHNVGVVLAYHSVLSDVD